MRVTALAVAGLVIAGMVRLDQAAEPSLIELKRSAAERRMRTIVLPKVHFADATPREALAFWGKTTAAAGAPMNLGVNYGTSEAKEPRLSFDRTEINCLDLLNLICDQAGLEWTVTLTNISIQPKAKTR